LKSENEPGDDMKKVVLVVAMLACGAAGSASAGQKWYLQMLGGGFNSAVVFEFNNRSKCENMKRGLIGNITSVKPKPTGRCTVGQPKGTTVVMSYR
jgi:hypothetical protein